MIAKRSRLLKAMLWTAGIATALTGLIGLAHTPHGRPLLAWLGAVPGCPVLQNADPHQIEEHRLVWVARNAGTEPAPARPALGFELGQSRRVEVQAGLEDRGAHCKSVLKETALECERFNGKEGDDALLKFDAGGRLVAVDVFHRTASSAEALRLVRETEARLGRLGQATRVHGERDERYLAGGRFRQLIVEYRFSDYSARVAATNFGRDLRVREQYDLLTRG